MTDRVRDSCENILDSKVPTDLPNLLQTLMLQSQLIARMGVGSWVELVHFS